MTVRSSERRTGMPFTDRGKTALVLSGGGSKGSYQAGVWQALAEAGIKIDMAFGTSVGAINAAMVVLGDPGRTAELWQTLHTDMIFDIDDDGSAFYGRLASLVGDVNEFGNRTDGRVAGAIERAAEKIDEKGKAFGAAIEKRSGMDADSALVYARKVITEHGVGSGALMQTLKKYISADDFFASDVDYGMITCTFPEFAGKYFYKEQIPENRLHEYIVASASCFPAARYAEIDGRKYVDGGYHDNLPILMAMFRGAENIIAVDLHEVGIVDRSVLEETEEFHPSFMYIEPSHDLGNFLVFDPEVAARNVRFGYLDGMKSFGLLDGIYYTFESGAFPGGDIAGAEWAAQIFGADDEKIYSRREFLKTLEDSVAAEYLTGPMDVLQGRPFSVKTAAQALKRGISRKAVVLYIADAVADGSFGKITGSRLGGAAIESQTGERIIGDEISAAEFIAKYGLADGEKALPE
jgi:NTE family protein